MINCSSIFIIKYAKAIQSFSLHQLQKLDFARDSHTTTTGQFNCEHQFGLVGTFEFPLNYTKLAIKAETFLNFG